MSIRITSAKILRGSISFVATLLCMVLMLPFSSLAASVTLNAADDVYTDSSRISTAGYTTADMASVKDDSQSKIVNYVGSTPSINVLNGRTVVKFDLSGISGTINSASFKFNVIDIHGAPILNLIKVNDNTWSEQPSGQSSFPTYTDTDYITQNSTPYSNKSVTTGWNSIDVKDYIQEKINAGSQYVTIAMTGYATNPIDADFDFVSLNNGGSLIPALTVDYTPSPTVTGVSPTSGPSTGGTSVTITGANLSAATAVKFGSTNATGFTVNSSTSITATAPAGTAGTVDITVATAGGTSTTSASDRFTYVAAPIVSSISPSSGSTGGGTTVVITGIGFVDGAMVTIGDIATTGVTWVSATSITANTPPGTAGAKNVVVTNPDTQTGTLTNGFTYVAASNTLVINLAGNGSGTVTSTSPDSAINCIKGSSSGCSADYTVGTPVTLTATGDWKSLFTGWGVNSPGGVVTMDSSKTVTATFDLVNRVKLVSSAASFASIQDACDAATSGDTILAQDYFFQEPNGVTIGALSAKTLTIRGGYTLGDASYSAITGVTSVQGPVKIQSGTLTVERLMIR